MGAEDAAASLRSMTFDTDILVWYLRGNDRARQFVADALYKDRRVSAMVYLELLQGRTSSRDVRTMRQPVNQNFSRVIPISEHVSHRAISLVEKHAVSDGMGRPTP